MIRACTGCGNLFETLDLRKMRCVKNCGRTDSHAARTLRREDHVLTFTGIDGEGVTRPGGEHIYDMLSVGNATLTSPDGGQLQWHQIFTFLYEQFQENPHDVYAGFFLGYDFTQWLRTLPQDRAAMLLSPVGRGSRKRTAPNSERLGPFPVRADGWEFDLLGMKRFKLRPEPAAGTKGAPWMYINDAGPFFQQSLLAVIDPKGWDEPVCSDAEYQTVVAGKADRGRRMDLDEQLDSRAATMRYNTMENEILGRVLGRLNRGFVAAGVRLGKRQWYGPGQAAQTWMNRIEAPTAAEIHDMVPRWALEAARQSYYGGWFEIFAHGHIPGQTHEYDINSAYPHMIAALPCLCGTWSRGRGAPVGRWSLVHAAVKGSDPLVGAMPHREKNATILRPSTTAGWYWWDEIHAAQRAGLIDHLVVDEHVSYEPCGHPPPFRDEMLHLYQRRLEVGKNSPEGKAYKLVYNSAYGKLAQSIGEPKYANPVYASLITSGCRRMILDAISTHPTRTADLLMVATDGVYFRRPHPGLDLDPARLGAWDHTVKHNLTLLMPGVYWDDTTRRALADGTAPKLKSRGVSARDLARSVAGLDEAFTRMIVRKGGPVPGWPTATVPIDFSMVTATQALARGTWDTAGTLVADAEKVLSASPHKKRAPHLSDDRGIWRTYPYAEGQQLESTPYDRTFGMKPSDAAAEEGLTPEGVITTDAIREMLK